MSYSLEELYYLYLQGCPYAFEEYIKKVTEIIKITTYSEVKRNRYIKYWDIDEIIANNLEDILKISHSFRYDKGCRMETYISKVFRNKTKTSFRNELRYQNNHNSISFEDLNEYYGNVKIAQEYETYKPDQKLEFKDTVSEAIDFVERNCSQTEAQIFVLRANGYSTKEIAEELDLTIKAVYNASARLNRKLKDLKKFDE